MPKKISLVSLVLLIVAAIDSIRNLPITAIFGSSLIFYLLFSAITFLIPISLISAEFASRYPEEGGVFPWIRHALGPKMAFFGVWLQWVNTAVWYPTILSFIAATSAYLINPTLAQNRAFLAGVILFIFWGLTLLNFFGIHVSAKINSFCASLGTLAPMALLILLGAFWLMQGNPIHISFDAASIFPRFDQEQNWISLIAIMASFLGMELSGVHVGDIQNPEKNFPKALGFSVLILIMTMLFGALSIAIVIPDREIRLVDGIMQTFSYFFDSFGLPFLVKPLAFAVILGSTGGMINWLLSPAKGLLQSAHYGFLPKFFTKKNRKGVATRVLFTQAILVSLFCLAFTFMPTINAFYWFFTTLSTELYTVMYILLFISAINLGRPKSKEKAYRIPKGLRKVSCFLGALSCCLTIVVSFFPPPEIGLSAGKYACWILLGDLFLILPVFLSWWRREKLGEGR